MLKFISATSKRYYSNENHIRRFNVIKQKFELNHRLLPDTFIVICLDGVNFKNLCSVNSFLKPVDQRHINLMNICAQSLMNRHLNEIYFAYGFSDEFSFILKSSSELFQRNSR
jgi:tRNA(His) guanylyltransferase